MAENIQETVAIVPLRAGSKGLPGKNTRVIAGMPLWRHAVDQARSAGIKRVLISTDIPRLLSAEPEPGVEIFERPSTLAADDTPIDAALSYVLNTQMTGSARIVLLQATSPLRTPVDITAAIDMHTQGQFDLVLTTCRADSLVLKWGQSNGAEFIPLVNPAHCFANRLILPPVYRPNGAVYVFDANWFRVSGSLASGKIGMIEMPIERSVDIDTAGDFVYAERLLRQNRFLGNI
jgi:CMP-N,N'-diacetyllegionaminic acid synthase